MDAPSKPEHAFKHAPHILWRRIKDEAVLLDKDSSVYYSLNDVGARIWDLIGQDESERGIVQKLCKEFDVEAQEARRDLDALLGQLSREKLILPGR